jgi:hypothetical protein
VAKIARSYTGQYLKSMLRKPNAARATAAA